MVQRAKSAHSKLQRELDPDLLCDFKSSAALPAPAASPVTSPVLAPQASALPGMPGEMASASAMFPLNSTPLKSSDRVCIFIDGANLFYAAMQLDLEVDYAKLLAQLVQGRNLLRAYFYTGMDPQNEKQQGFLLWMRRHGYRVVAKELIHLPDGSRKANLDVEIAIDMMMLAEYCQTMVLLSGDGDLAYAVNAIAYRGVQVEVVSLPSMTSDSLINVADHYVDLATLKPLISKTA